MKNIENNLKVFKQNKAITLVALVITVVVMLILAGVAIAAVIDGEGLFSKTRQATETYENATREENDKIQSMINQIDEYLEGNIEEGEETTTVEPDAIAQIGDFVNYSVEVGGVTYDKWRILDFDNNGHMEIVCYNGPEFAFEKKTKSDYANAIKVLNDASVPYGRGTYGYSTRHLGSDPSNPASYETIDESYVYFYRDYENIESLANYPYLSQTHHESDVIAVQSFSNTVAGNKLATASWLASRDVYNAAGIIFFFYMRYVDNLGTPDYDPLYRIEHSGSAYVFGFSHAIAPVVSLESEIKLIPGKGDGSEESPWQLTK